MRMRIHVNSITYRYFNFHHLGKSNIDRWIATNISGCPRKSDVFWGSSDETGEFIRKPSTKLSTSFLKWCRPKKHYVNEKNNDNNVSNQVWNTWIVNLFCFLMRQTYQPTPSRYGRSAFLTWVNTTKCLLDDCDILLCTEHFSHETIDTTMKLTVKMVKQRNNPSFDKKERSEWTVAQS